MAALKHPLVSAEPRDGLVLRFIDPRLARILESLPEFGELVVAMVNGRPQRSWKVTRTFLDHEEGPAHG